MPPRDEWRRYVAPAAFLLAVTVAVVVVRAGVESGSSAPATAPPPPTAHKTVSTTPTTSSSASTSTLERKSFWIVKAGDTFGVISSKTGVPVATIEQLNPSVSSTSLTIGEKIRVR